MVYWNSIPYAYLWKQLHEVFDTLARLNVYNYQNALSITHILNLYMYHIIECITIALQGHYIYGACIKGNLRITSYSYFFLITRCQYIVT